MHVVELFGRPGNEQLRRDVVMAVMRKAGNCQQDPPMRLQERKELRIKEAAFTPEEVICVDAGDGVKFLAPKRQVGGVSMHRMYLIGRNSQAEEKRLILIGVAPQIARRYGKTVLLVKKSRGERHAASQIKHPRAPKYRMALQDLLCQLERVGSHDLAANEFDGIPLSVRILHIDHLFQNGEHSFTT